VAVGVAAARTSGDARAPPPPRAGPDDDGATISAMPILGSLIAAKNVSQARAARFLFFFFLILALFLCHSPARRAVPVLMCRGQPA